MDKPTGYIDVVWEDVRGHYTEMCIPTYGENKPIAKGKYEEVEEEEDG